MQWIYYFREEAFRRANFLLHALSSIYSGNTVPISGGRSIRIAMNGSVKEPNHMIATLGK